MEATIFIDAVGGSNELERLFMIYVYVTVSFYLGNSKKERMWVQLKYKR